MPVSLVCLVQVTAELSGAENLEGRVTTTLCKSAVSSSSVLRKYIRKLVGKRAWTTEG